MTQRAEKPVASRHACNACSGNNGYTRVRSKLGACQRMPSACVVSWVRTSGRALRMRARAGLMATSRLIHVAICTVEKHGCRANRQHACRANRQHACRAPSSVRICGTRVRTLRTGSQSMSPCPHTSVCSSMTPCTQHSRSTGTLHGPRGTFILLCNDVGQVRSAIPTHTRTGLCSTTRCRGWLDGCSQSLVCPRKTGDLVAASAWVCPLVACHLPFGRLWVVYGASWTIEVGLPCRPWHHESAPQVAAATSTTRCQPLVYMALVYAPVVSV